MIFVSYSREDKTVCDEIVRALEDKGYKVWQDTKKIRGGNKWRADVEEGIKNCDIFIILLSKNRSENSQKELELADKQKKKIIGIRLKSQKKLLPQGYEIVLSGTHQIDLADGFAPGLASLFEALGPAESDELAGPRGFWQRTVRKAQRFRAVVVNSNLGPAVVKYGAVALAGAASVAVAMAKANQQQQAMSLQRYRAAVDKILNEYVSELKRTLQMNPHDYLREFRPRVRQLLGRLEGMEVPTEALKERHRELADNLQRTVEQYDDVFTKLEGGDDESCRRAMQRFAESFVETIQNYKNLLDRIN